MFCLQQDMRFFVFQEQDLKCMTDFGKFTALISGIIVHNGFIS